jgi:hypothetical protein
MKVSKNIVTSALDGGACSASRPGRFTRGERAPGTHWIGGWVDHRASLDATEKRKISCPFGEPPIAVAVRSKACTVFARSNAGIVD